VPGGRPTKMTPETLAKLEQAFLMGCTDQEACLFAGIIPSTLYRYQEANPEYCERKDTLKQNPYMKARGVLIDALDANDVNTAHKIIDRKEGSKVAVSGPEGGHIAINFHGVPGNAPK